MPAVLDREFEAGKPEEDRGLEQEDLQIVF